MIYILQAEGTNLYKIGFTNNPVGYRIASLQTGNPYNLVLYHSLDGDTLVEKVLHARFSCRKVRGEWFKLSSDDLNLFHDKDWLEHYIYSPCSLHMAGVPRPCSCGDVDCIFCEPTNYDEITSSLDFDGFEDSDLDFADLF